MINLTTKVTAAMFNVMIALTRPQRQNLAAVLVKFAQTQVMFWKDGAAMTVSQAEDLAGQVEHGWTAATTITDQDVRNFEVIGLTMFTWDAHPNHKGQLATLERAWKKLWDAAPEDMKRQPVDSQDEAVARIKALMNPEPQPPTDQSKIVGHLKNLTLGQQIQIGTFVVEHADLDRDGFSTTHGKFPTAEALADWLLDHAPQSTVLAQPFRDFIDHGPGDAECTSCHRMFWSGQGHPTLAICGVCWTPKGKPQAPVPAPRQAQPGASPVPVQADHHAVSTAVQWEAEHPLDFSQAPLPEGHRPRSSSEFPRTPIDPGTLDGFDPDVATVKSLLTRRGSQWLIDTMNLFTHAPRI